jgi:hypothetical protein
MRDQLAEVLALDDKAEELLLQAKPTVVDQSGEAVRGAAHCLGTADAGTAGAAEAHPGFATVKRPHAAG